MKYYISTGYKRNIKTGELEHREKFRTFINIFEDLWPEEIWIVHHKDGNRMNNDISNLQIMKQSEHGHLHNKNNKLTNEEKAIRRLKQRGKYRGATYHKTNRNPWTKTWQCSIECNGNSKSLGYFHDPISCEIVYEFVRSEL